MPLSTVSNGSVQIQCGYYSLSDDEYVFTVNSDTVIGNGSLEEASIGYDLTPIQSNSRRYSIWRPGEMPCYRVSFYSDDFGVINEQLLIQLSNISFSAIKDKSIAHSDQLSFLMLMQI